MSIHLPARLPRRGLAAVAVAALGAVLPVTTSGAVATAAAEAATAQYVVVFGDGVNARAKASKAGVKPRFVYSQALSGFAADLTTAQRHRLAADPQTLMVTRSDRTSAPTAQPGATPVENTAQLVPHGIRRIGTLASPTARVDGIDDRVDVDVAVVDTGVDSTQPDVNVVGGVACAAGAGHGDRNGHGTMVAGVVGALDNAYGVVGVAPGARIWSVRVLDEKGMGTDANLLCGLDWVMAHRTRIDVANLSLGDTGASDGRCGLANRDPIHWAICHLVDRGRVVTVVAAGNGAADAAGVVPAAYPQVVTVSSMADSDGQPGGLGGPTCAGGADDSFSRRFSNYGPAIDLAAPGECVGSLFPGGVFGLGSGTSFAAPHVTGAAALYRATHPRATPAQVRAALLAHRERTALRGDPDGAAEGVVNVAGW